MLFPKGSFNVCDKKEFFCVIIRRVHAFKHVEVLFLFKCAEQLCRYDSDILLCKWIIYFTDKQMVLYCMK